MTRTHVYVLSLLTALGTVLAGCGGGPALVSGKVIAGNISFVGVVDTSDARLAQDGLPGALVEVYTQPERNGPRVGHVTSGRRGDFTLSIDESGALVRPAEFRGTLAGYLPASTAMSIPASNRRVLVILKSMGGPGTAK